MIDLLHIAQELAAEQEFTVSDVKFTKKPYNYFGTVCVKIAGSDYPINIEHLITRKDKMRILTNNTNYE